MRRAPHHVGMVALVLLAACSGGSGDREGSDTADTADAPATGADSSPADTTGGAEPDAEPETTAGEPGAETPTPTDDSATAATPPVASEPVEGALASLLSFDFGLFAIDRDSGESRPVSIEGAGYSDREHHPLLAGDTAYTLTYTPLEGQTYSHEVGVGSIQLLTGVATEITRIGIDRADDESQDLTSYRLLGADDRAVWVESKPFGVTEAALITYTSYDAGSGDEGSQLTDVFYEESSDAGQCTVAVRSPIVTPDGRLIGQTDGWPADIDTETGEATPLLVSCFDPEEPTLLSVVGADAASGFWVPETDAPLDPASVEWLAGTARLAAVDHLMVEGDGSLWWLFNSHANAPVGDGYAGVIAGGVVEFDLATNEIVNVFPLGDAVGTWLPDNDLGDISRLNQADLLYRDGALWIMDHREDQPLRRVDATTGEVTEIEIPAGDGFDAVDARLITNDPEAIWLDVTRKVVTEVDGTRTAEGQGYLDQIDPATGTLVLSIPQADILPS